MSIGKEELEAVTRVINNGCLSGYQGNWSDAFYGGPEIKALEKEWSEYFGVKHAIACNSATSGLWMACAAIGIQEQRGKDFFYSNIYDTADRVNEAISEVIVTPYSMTCSASIPLHFCAKPVFADIEPDYFCLDPKSVEEKITPATKAIIVVDLFGQPYDADAINAIAEKYSKIYGHKIYVIEDAAQAIGATYKGKYAGTLGDIGIYSLNRHKHIQCGEGGVVVTNDSAVAMRLRLEMNHAEAVCNDYDRSSTIYADGVPAYTQKPLPLGSHSLVGMNLRMTELSAAVAREQLKKLDGILKVYREYATYFHVKVRPRCEHAFYRYALTKYNHPAIYFILRNGSKLFNIKQHYITPIYQMPLFKQLGYDQHQCPVCEDVESNIILEWIKDEP